MYVLFETLCCVFELHHNMFNLTAGGESSMKVR